MIDLATPAVFTGTTGRYISQSMNVPVKDLAYDAMERGKLREISEKLIGRFL